VRNMRQLLPTLSLLLAPFGALCGQWHVQHPITVAEARAILGADPVVIPNYHFEIARQGPGAILVVQFLDSGKVIWFIEDRRGRPSWSRFQSSGSENTAEAVSRLESQPRLWAYRDRVDRYRRVGEVSVHYFGEYWGSPITQRERELLDRLAPID